MSSEKSFALRTALKILFRQYSLFLVPFLLISVSNYELDECDEPVECEDCNCDLDGTVSAIGVCYSYEGQCQCRCKPNVGSRECSQCIDGTYQLDENDFFGCKDCGCNFGGLVNNICDKQTGQCPCKPGITGRQCNRPLENNYFPPLFQHQFEIEDGRSPVGTQVQYGYDENVFPGFSWRGYATFSDIQKEVLLDLDIEKSSLYHIYLYYLNLSEEKFYGNITFTPESFGGIQQSYKMLFKERKSPMILKVAGKKGLEGSPGRWTVSIKVEKPLFLDYMVLLPEAYYNATNLREDVSSPCVVHGINYKGPDKECLFYRYLPIPLQAKIKRGENGFFVDGDERKKTHLYYKIEVHSPDHPTFEAQVIIEDGELHEAVLPLPNCPSISGCRTVVRSKDTHATAFQIAQNYQLNIRQRSSKNVWFEYVLTIPSKEFHINLLNPLPLSKAEKFLQECRKSIFLDPSFVSGFCRESAFILTSQYNNGALPCQCDRDGALSSKCQEFGGACKCKPHVIGRTCSRCRSGYIGFPNCELAKYEQLAKYEL